MKLAPTFRSTSKACSLLSVHSESLPPTYRSTSLSLLSGPLLNLTPTFRSTPTSLVAQINGQWPGPPREILQGGTRLFRGTGDRLRLLSKLRIWGPIKSLVNFHMTNNQNSEVFSEFYIIIFLNKLNIHVVENTPQKWKNLNKTSMAKAMGPFRDSRAPSCSPGPGPMYRLNPPLISPDSDRTLTV